MSVRDLDAKLADHAEIRRLRAENQRLRERLRSAPGETPTGSEIGWMVLEYPDDNSAALGHRLKDRHSAELEAARLREKGSGTYAVVQVVSAGGSTTPEKPVDPGTDFQQTLTDFRDAGGHAIDVLHALDRVIASAVDERLRLATPTQPEPEPEAPGETEADRQWRESGMWQEWLAGYERVSDDERARDPRYMSVERWTYRLLSTRHCPGSLPVAHAIIEDLDALATPTHDLEALREALEEIAERPHSSGCSYAGQRNLPCGCHVHIARRALAQHVGGEG